MRQLPLEIPIFLFFSNTTERSAKPIKCRPLTHQVPVLGKCRKAKRVVRILYPGEIGGSRGRPLGRPPTGRPTLALPMLQGSRTHLQSREDFSPIGYIVTRITLRPDWFGTITYLCIAPACTEYS